MGAWPIRYLDWKKSLMIKSVNDHCIVTHIRSLKVQIFGFRITLLLHSSSLFGPGDVPDLGVGVLARRDEAAVVQPRDPGDLGLVVGVPEDAVLVRGLD